MPRAILHSDLNCFYASVEIMQNPALRDKAIAVCGATEDRHGIVLAKSELAKKAGIKTGMVNWEAKQRCPHLILVQPHYDQYLKYSRLTRAIYERFTDQVEPYGMDECWLDVSDSAKVCGDALAIAQKIRRTIREELGMTVSIGVSFNKIFAKLGSDMKKPDAVTVITPESYRQKVWPLPVGELLYVGRATQAKLQRNGIHTIGELAATSPSYLRSQFGKNGLMLWSYANGSDTSRVMRQGYTSPIKSIGHGITCLADLVSFQEVAKVFLYLSQDIGHRLRLHNLCASGVQVTVRDSDLMFRQYQAQLPYPTQSPLEITQLAKKLFREHHYWQPRVRALTVRATNLQEKDLPQQLNLFGNNHKREQRDRLEASIERIHGRFGPWSVYPASLMGDLKLPDSSSHEYVKMPGKMFS